AVNGKGEIGRIPGDLRSDVALDAHAEHAAAPIDDRDDGVIAGRCGRGPTDQPPDIARRQRWGIGHRIGWRQRGPDYAIIGAGNDHIRALDPKEHITAGTADELIVAAAADQLVVSRTA